MVTLLVIMSTFEVNSQPTSDVSIGAEQQPSLPMPPEGGTTTSDATQKIIVNGDKLNLDELGPMIVNADGTVRRIANWQGLTAREQAVAWRRIAKRNQERVEELKAAGVTVGEKTEGEGEAEWDKDGSEEGMKVIEDGSSSNNL